MKNKSRYKFLILDTYYPEFLSGFYQADKDLADTNYQAQRDFILSQGFGTADFYSRNLKLLGHDAEEIIPNNSILQNRWASENQLKLNRFGSRLCNLPKIGRFFRSNDPLLAIVKEQVRQAKPDVLYVQAISYFPPDFLFELKKHVRLLIGQIASSHPPLSFYSPYDLVLSSLPNFVYFLNAKNIPATYFRIGFEPSVIKEESIEKRYDCTFVGGFSPHHSKGTKDLEKLARSIPISLFGYGKEHLSPDSVLRNYHCGSAWGVAMYSILQRSRIVLNRHADFADKYANNMRLFEATGAGSLLITDAKENLGELFEVGKEVVAYRSVEELIELVRHFLTHESEREKIALAGKQRTHKEHTYFHRMEELVNIVNAQLK